MGIFSKLVTAVRGGATEIGESIVDSQAMRILDQEIRDADTELTRSKDGLVGLMAKKKVIEQKVSDLTRQLAEYENYALQALNKGDEALAMDIANRVAEIESELATEKDLAAQYAASETQAKQAIQSADSNLRRLKQQVDTVKVTESVQRAQATIAERHSGAQTSMNTALSSLEKIKARQQEQTARFEAAKEIAQGPSGDLQARLRDAGIVPGGASGASVLARLRSQGTPALPKD
jgi:phage shock protein A